ncbi:hypothetical protein CYMTET_49535 [Cymbomonas tetramitiformis]|uniref:EF-hand domain-containing protein n=1 Tax=Cymbomonas tetramitiformis TaxID=36881 RepID=A0AAE0EVQ0_9CHLO|nr:hypothetical protein CYMTET_49535 [Cymbomonas tetramitiformis]
MVAGKCAVPERLKCPGWDYPRGNILMKYFEECERRGVMANSVAAQQFMIRVRQTQTLPFHKIVNKNRTEKLDLVFNHLDADDSGEVDLAELTVFAKAMDPRADAVELAKKQLAEMDADKNGAISREEFRTALEVVWADKSDMELDQGVLELLSLEHDLANLPTVEARLRVVFKHLDFNNSGFLEMPELENMGRSFNPRVDRENAKCMMIWMDKNHDQRVSMDEFVETMTELAKDFSEAETLTGLMEIMTENRAKYDFSTAYLGPAGVLTVLNVIKDDTDMHSLSLRSCGIRNDTVLAIKEALQHHRSIRKIDLGSNPISDAGAVHLLELLKANTAIDDLLITDTNITRNWSNTSPVIGSREFEDGLPLERQLAANRRAKESAARALDAVDLDQILKEHKDQMKTLFYTLAGVDGRVSFHELEDGLKTMSEEWGVLPDVIVKLLEPVRIFSGKDRSDDEGVANTLTYPEFVQALRHEKSQEQLRIAFREHKDELKAVFYACIELDGRVLYNNIHSKIFDEVDLGVDKSIFQSEFTPEFFFGPEASVAEDNSLMSDTARCYARYSDSDGRAGSEFLVSTTAVFVATVKTLARASPGPAPADYQQAEAHRSSVRRALNGPVMLKASPEDKKAYKKNSQSDWQGMYEELPSFLQSTGSESGTPSEAYSWLMESVDVNGRVAYRSAAEEDEDGEVSGEFLPDGNSLTGLTGCDGRESTMYY